MLQIIKINNLYYYTKSLAVHFYYFLIVNMFTEETENENETKQDDTKNDMVKNNEQYEGPLTTTSISSKEGTSSEIKQDGIIEKDTVENTNEIMGKKGELLSNDKVKVKIVPKVRENRIIINICSCFTCALSD